MTGATEFDPVGWLERAVAIPSHEDASEMRAFLVETLERRGLSATVDDAGNTVASRGTGSPHLVLNTHVDTVSPHVAFERDGDVVRGRGACDAKGPLAAILAAFFAVDPAAGRVTLAVTPDEETLSTGAAALVDSGPVADADAYVVGEPTGLSVCTAAKGRFEGTISLSGVAAHAAEPATGTNAVAAAEQALAGVRGFDADAAAAVGVEAVADDHPELGEATLTPTVIEGGSATNQVPASCRIVVDRRSVPPETAEGFREALSAHLRATVPASVEVDFALTDRETPFLEAFETPADHDLVTTLSAAAAEIADGAGEVRPFGAATEASYFAPAPTVVFGPGVLADGEGAVAHADREYVRIADVEAAAEALTRTVRSLVG